MIGSPIRIVARWLCWAVFLFALAVPLHASFAAEPGDEKPLTSSQPVYVIPVHQTIESGLQSFLERAFAEAEAAKAKHIILDLDTFGGRVDAAEDIGKLIRSSQIPTIAFVHGKAVSAGSYIALNANEIAMEPGSSIGAAAVVDIAGNRITDAKIVSHWLSEIRAAAELRGRNPDIAEGMVDENKVVPMPEINKTKEKGQIISLSAEEAFKVGYAEKIASNLEDVVEYIGAEGHPVITVQPTPAEKLSRFLTHPAVMTLLLLVGIAGVAIELFVPGFGLPGILGIASFTLYFFGHFVAGFAGWEDIFLFVAGALLLAIEIFVPSFGILGILGALCLISGVVLAAYDKERALLQLGVAFAVAAVIVAIVIKYFKHRGIWNRFILKEQLNSEEGYVSVSPKDHLLGKTGVSVTPLRPAGTAIIDGERIDVVTDGEFIDSHRQIVVSKVEGPRVVVKEAAE